MDYLGSDWTVVAPAALASVDALVLLASWWLVLVEILRSEGWLESGGPDGGRNDLEPTEISYQFSCFLMWQYAKVLCPAVSDKQVLVTPLHGSVQTVHKDSFCNNVTDVENSRRYFE